MMKDSMAIQGIWKFQAVPVSQSSGGINFWQALIARLNIMSFCPQRIKETEQKEMTAPDGRKQWMLKNLEIATYMKLDEQEKYLWDQLDGSKSVQDLLTAYSQKYEQVSPSKFASFLENLFSNGFLTIKKVTIFSEVFRKLNNRTLKSKIFRLFNRRVEFKNLNPVFAWLYKSFFRIFYILPLKAILSLISLVGAGVFVFISTREKIDFLKFADSYTFGLAVFLLALAVLVFFHELGHAFTVKYYGREVRKGGIIFCLFYPTAFYVNTDDMWMEESKKARIFVSWSGLFVNLIFGGLCSLTYLAVPHWPMSSLFYTAALISYILFFLNINPFMSSDGYFMLADSLGIANLRMRSAYFVHKVFPIKLKLIWVTKTSRIKKALGLRIKQLPLSVFFVGTRFSKEERVFTLFGFFSLMWSFVGMALAAGLYISVLNIIFKLWTRPNLVLRFWLCLVILALAAPLAFILYRLSMIFYKAGNNWLKAHRIFEDAQASYKYFARLCIFIIVVPIILILIGGQKSTIQGIASYWFLVWQLLACFLVAFYCGKVTLEDEPFRRKMLFKVLLLMAVCFLSVGLGTFIFWHFGNPELVRSIVSGLSGLMIALDFVVCLIAFSLNGIEGGNRLERILMGAIVLGTPLLASLLAVQLSKSSIGSPLIVARVGFASIAMISVFLLLPTLFNYSKTEMKIPWTYLFFGLLFSSTWNVIWLLRIDTARTGIRFALNEAHLAAGSLLAMGVGFYYLIYGKGKFERKKRERDVSLPLPSRMRGAFLYMLQAMVDTFANFYGRRTLASFEKEYNSASLKHSLGAFLFEGKIKDEIHISQHMIELGVRYRDALQNLILLVSKRTGQLFYQKILSKIYDELYWDERELLTSYVFRGTEWGAHFVKSLEEGGIDPKQLLTQMPLFFDFSAQEIAEICSLLKLEKYGPGELVIEQGTEGERMYMVRSGRLEVLKNENGTEIRVDFIESNDYFGEAALMKEEPRNATVRSVTNTELFVLEKRDFHRWVKPRVDDPKQLLELMDKERFLKRVPLFSGLSSIQLSKVTSKFRLEVIPSGTTIMRQGDAADKFYVINKGVVDVMQLTPDGKTNLLGERGPGESLGEIALIQGGVRTATVVAKTDVKLLSLIKADFNSLMIKYLSLQKGVELVATRRKRLDRERILSA
jgi:CRP-like cAMP-binding protein